MGAKGKYFSEAELSCQHCGQNEMDQNFVDELDRLRVEFGRPLVVTSAYRCPEHNNNVSSTGFSGPHTTGLAVDLKVDRGEAWRLLELIFLRGFPGVGVAQKGGGRFIHIDAIQGPTRPTVWSY